MKSKGSIIIALALFLVAVPLAMARMTSTEIERNLCHTVGGGKFKEIPGFPGEMIDRRLLNDIRKMKRKYKIFITDGYSTDPVHSANGEHPLGLALDIVPNFARGGDWEDIDRLAEWAEPRQNEPRSPFRWVGYDGDSNHGSGHHLHLSYSHGASRFGEPVEEMYSVKCPGKTSGSGGGEGGGGEGEGGSSSGGTGGGGVGTRSSNHAHHSHEGIFDLAPIAPEESGVGL